MFGETLGAPLRPAIFNCDRATLDPTKFTEALHKSGEP
jgi:hypothetical protein